MKKGPNLPTVKVPADFPTWERARQIQFVLDNVLKAPNGAPILPPNTLTAGVFDLQKPETQAWIEGRIKFYTEKAEEAAKEAAKVTPTVVWGSAPSVLEKGKIYVEKSHDGTLQYTVLNLNDMPVARNIADIKINGALTAEIQEKLKYKVLFNAAKNEHIHYVAEDQIKDFDAEMQDMKDRVAQLLEQKSAGNDTAERELGKLRREYSAAKTAFRNAFEEPLEKAVEAKQHEIEELKAEYEENTKELKSRVNLIDMKFREFKDDVKELEGLGSEFDYTRNQIAEAINELNAEKARANEELGNLNKVNEHQKKVLEDEKRKLDNQRRAVHKIGEATVVQRFEIFKELTDGPEVKKIIKPAINMEQWREKGMLKGISLENVRKFVTTEKDIAEKKILNEKQIYQRCQKLLAPGIFDENIILGIAAGYITRDYNNVETRGCLSLLEPRDALKNHIIKQEAQSNYNFLVQKFYAAFTAFRDYANDVGINAFVSENPVSGTTVLGGVNSILEAVENGNFKKLGNGAHKTATTTSTTSGPDTQTTTTTTTTTAPKRTIADLEKEREEKANEANKAHGEVLRKKKTSGPVNLDAVLQDAARLDAEINQNFEEANQHLRDLENLINDAVEDFEKFLELEGNATKPTGERLTVAFNMAKAKVGQAQEELEENIRADYCLKQYNGSNAKECLTGAFAIHKDRTKRPTMTAREFAAYANEAKLNADQRRELEKYAASNNMKFGR